MKCYTDNQRLRLLAGQASEQDFKELCKWLDGKLEQRGILPEGVEEETEVSRG